MWKHSALGLVIAGLSAALAGYDHGAASGALQNLVHLKGDTLKKSDQYWNLNGS